MSCQKAFGGYHIGRVVTAPLFQRVRKSHGNTKYTSKLKKGILRIDSLCAMVSFFLCSYLSINILNLTDRSKRVARNMAYDCILSFQQPRNTRRSSFRSIIVMPPWVHLENRIYTLVFIISLNLFCIFLYCPKIKILCPALFISQ